MKSKIKKKSTDVNELETKQFYEVDTSELPPPDIIAYNELRSCADLNRLYKDNTLEIQPEFQREIIWKETDKSRFIDSLIKQLPIPSMCISLDLNTQKMQVIDGLQRMHTITKFLNNDEWKISKLDDIDKRISGKKVSEIKKKYSELFRRLQNVSLPINILRCDLSKDSHMEYIFTIFHRLNSGGMKLNNQEIRNCIFSGNFNDLLKDLNQNTKWKKLLNIKDDRTYRFLKEELILRFLAFYDRLGTYEGKLGKFLNEYMNYNRKLNNDSLEKKKEIFSNAIDLIFDKITKGKSLEKTSNAIVESLLYGVSKNYDHLKKLTESGVLKLYRKFLKDRTFSEESLSEGISRKEKVAERLNTAKRIFKG